MKLLSAWCASTGLLTATCPAPSTLARAQFIGQSVPEFTTSAGTVGHAGDTWHLGRGTLPDGSFRYVYVPENVFTGRKQQHFPFQLTTLSVRVKDIRVQRSRHFGDKTVAVSKADTLNGCVDLNPAEASGESMTAHIRRAAVSAAGTGGMGTAAPPLSVADELLKLKQLYDQHGLTKPEYEAQRARLLQ